MSWAMPSLGPSTIAFINSIPKIMSDQLMRSYIASLLPEIPHEVMDQLTAGCVPSSIPKHSLLIEEGKIISKSFFLESGYVHSFVLDQDGVEVTTNIYEAPCFVNDFTSFFKQIPSTQSFRALTDCQCLTLSIELVEHKFHLIPAYREFGRMLVLDHYDKLDERMLGMIKDKAETRYLKLLSKHPDLFQNVSLKIIASYLGITDTSLSRIRKELFSK